LPALNASLEKPALAASEGIDRKQAAARAAECVEKLNQNPNDLPAREQLARLLAESLAKPELGIEQLQLLLTIKDAPEAKAVEWLALQAAWQIKYQQDPQSGRRTLERLIEAYPQSPQAFAARRHLSLMDLESRLRAARAGAVKPREIKLRI
jgi:hypothetical protein